MATYSLKVENAHDYPHKELMHKIKAIYSILREMGAGGLKEANNLLHKGAVLKVHSKRQVREILKVCDAEGLILDIHITRRLTPAEYDKL